MKVTFESQYGQVFGVVVKINQKPVIVIGNEC